MPCFLFCLADDDLRILVVPIAIYRGCYQVLPLYFGGGVFPRTIAILKLMLALFDRRCAPRRVSSGHAWKTRLFWDETQGKLEF